MFLCIKPRGEGQLGTVRVSKSRTGNSGAYQRSMGETRERKMGTKRQKKRRKEKRKSGRRKGGERKEESGKRKEGRKEKIPRQTGGHRGGVSPSGLGRCSSLGVPSWQARPGGGKRSLSLCGFGQPPQPRPPRSVPLERSRNGTGHKGHCLLKGNDYIWPIHIGYCLDA